MVKKTHSTNWRLFKGSKLCFRKTQAMSDTLSTDFGNVDFVLAN